MLVESKSNLARLMATENLIVEERNVPTAYFDPKNRILTVPILSGNLSSELYDLLLGHEVGHALETPANGWHDSVVEHKVNRDILNVCEDARIEKKIKRRFPGLKPSFSRGYRELLDMDFFGINDMDVNELNFIDRVNLYTKGGSFLGIQFTVEEEKLLREIENAETFDETVKVSRKVQAFMQKALDEQKKKNEELKIKTIKVTVKADSAGQPSQEKQEAIGEDKLEKGEKGVSESEKESEEEESENEGTYFKSVDENGDSIEDDSEEDASQKSSTTEVAGKTGGNDTPKDISSITDRKFREKEKSLYEQSAKTDMIYSDIPKINLSEKIIGYDVILKEVVKHNKAMVAEGYFGGQFKIDELIKNFIEYKNQSNKVVSYLVKEFELRKNADKQSRARISKTGELNMDRIYEYKLNDDIFRRMTNVPNGKSHGLVMFIDWSGSMEPHIGATMRQLLNLVMFCKKVNIPYEVYAFSSYVNEKTVRSHQKLKPGELLGTKFSLLNIFSSKMKNKEFTEMAAILLHRGSGPARRYFAPTLSISYPDMLDLGGTPLNSSLIAAFDLIPKFQKENKLQIVNALFLTDGESCSLEGRISMRDPYTGRVVVTNEHIPNKNRRSFYRDPVTKASVEIKKNRSLYRMDSNAETDALLRLLKQRVGCNLIGFFVAKRKDIRSALLNFTNNSKEYETLESEFMKNGSTVITSYGYDEYYMLKSEDLDTDDDDEIVVKSTTTRGLVSAFSKYTGNKVSSRIILNRFIKLIA